MGNPYSAPTLNNYNQSPPDDDGSQVSGNLVEWSKHIDKIGDPLKNFAQAISDNVETAFGLIFGNGVRSLTTNTTLTEADQGQVFFSDSDLTHTLPSASDVGTNWVFAITINSGSSNGTTLNTSGSETINSESSLTLLPNAFALVVSDGSNFRAISSDEDALKVPFVVDDTVALGFGTWRTPHSERATMVIIDVSAFTDGTTDGIVRFQIDQSGGSTADETYTIAFSDDAGTSSNTQIRTTSTFMIPPGASYQVENNSDPNSSNAINQITEYTL